MPYNEATPPPWEPMGEHRAYDRLYYLRFGNPNPPHHETAVYDVYGEGNEGVRANAEIISTALNQHAKLLALIRTLGVWISHSGVCPAAFLKANECRCGFDEMTEAITLALE